MWLIMESQVRLLWPRRWTFWFHNCHEFLYRLSDSGRSVLHRVTPFFSSVFLVTLCSCFFCTFSIVKCNFADDSSSHLLPAVRENWLVSSRRNVRNRRKLRKEENSVSKWELQKKGMYFIYINAEVLKILKYLPLRTELEIYSQFICCHILILLYWVQELFSFCMQLHCDWTQKASTSAIIARQWTETSSPTLFSLTSIT